MNETSLNIQAKVLEFFPDIPRGLLDRLVSFAVEADKEGDWIKNNYPKIIKGLTDMVARGGP